MPFSISDCPINRRSHRPDQGVPRKTRARGRPDASHGGRYPKDLNPRQGITTVSAKFCQGTYVLDPKDLNPRQGITTHEQRVVIRVPIIVNPKDLNPRQGITTCRLQRVQL